jgi:5-methylcytosine-specific restriction endonuclease McrA
MAARTRQDWQRWARRGNTTQRGIGWAHQADKRRLIALHKDGDLCWRCGQPMYKWQALDRDHILDRAHGGAEGPAVLAHAACNRSAGASAGNRERSRGRRWAQARQW